MLEAEKIDLFHYLISFELCFYIISHSSSKHPLSLSEFTDKEIDILPSKANLATVNPNLVAKCVPRVMLGWWFTVDQGTLIRLSQTENTWGAGVRHAELHIILKSIQDLRAHLIWGHSNLDKLFQGLKKYSCFYFFLTLNISKCKALEFLMEACSFIFYMALWIIYKEQSCFNLA